MHNFSKQFLAILFSGSLIFNGTLFAAQEQEASVVSYRAVIEDFIKNNPLEVVGGSVLTTALISFLISVLVVRGKNKAIKELTVDKETAKKNITQLESQVTELQGSIQTTEQNKTELETQITDLTSEVEKLQNELSAANLEEKTTELERIIAELREKQIELEEAKNDLGVKIRLSNQEREDISKLENILAEKQTEKETVEQELETMLQQIGDLNSFVQTYENLLREFHQLQALSQDAIIMQNNSNFGNYDVTQNFNSIVIPDPNQNNFGNLTITEGVIECGRLYNTVNKIEGGDNFDVVTYVHSSLHEFNIENLTCDYIIIPISDQDGIYTVETVKTKFDQYAQYRQQQVENRDKVLKIIYVSREINNKNVLELIQSDSFYRRNIDTIVALGTDNLGYAVEMIKYFNGLRGDQYVYAKSIFYNFDNAVLMIYAANVREAQCLLDEIEYQGRDGIISKRQVGIVGNFYTKKGKKKEKRVHKLAEGKESPVKYLDLACGYNKISFSEPSELIEDGLSSFADDRKMVESAHGIRTNFRLQRKKNDNGDIIGRYLTYRDTTVDKSTNSHPLKPNAQWTVSEVRFNYETKRRSEDLLEQQKEFGDLFETNTIGQTIEVCSEVALSGVEFISNLSKQAGDVTYTFADYTGLASRWNNLPALSDLTNMGYGYLIGHNTNEDN